MFYFNVAGKEQHIRRENPYQTSAATTLIALNATIYLSLLVKMVKAIGRIKSAKAHYAAEKISKIKGFELIFKNPFFNEFVVKHQTLKIKEELLKHKIIAGYELENDFLN